MTDLVNNPQHYQAGNGIEAIDVIEGFLKKYDHRDQVIKYNLRAGDKGNFLQDLEKSAWYLTRTIENFKAGKFTVEMAQHPQGRPLYVPEDPYSEAVQWRDPAPRTAASEETLAEFVTAFEEALEEHLEDEGMRIVEILDRPEDPEESTPKPEKLAIYKDEDDDYWAIGNDGFWRWYCVDGYEITDGGLRRTWDHMVTHYEVNLCSSEESDRIEPLIRKYQEKKGH